jgi:hypothetical protein
MGDEDLNFEMKKKIKEAFQVDCSFTLSVLLLTTSSVARSLTEIKRAPVMCWR